MIYIIHWPYRWLCRIGLHEYYIGCRNMANEDEPMIWDDEYKCDVCGKRKPHVK